MAPFLRIQWMAAEVSRPPEKASPTRSPTGSFWRMCDIVLAGSERAGASGRGQKTHGSTRGCVGRTLRGAGEFEVHAQPDLGEKLDERVDRKELNLALHQIGDARLSDAKERRPLRLGEAP